MSQNEHPFAPFVRQLGRGRHGARPLAEEEAYRAMRMILANEVAPEQLGAFLMLIRIREETPQELAGFVRAARESLGLTTPNSTVQIDWSSYAGKRRQLPWFILSALLLAGSGVRVFMHGVGGRNDGRVYTPSAIQSLGIPLCDSLDEATDRLYADNFAFLPLDRLSPALNMMLELRQLLGLRSPINSVVRMLNPFSAPYLIQGIFHPGYKDIHQQAGLLLKQSHLAVLKGEGGEIERNPDVVCDVATLHNGIIASEQWPSLFDQRHLKDETMDVYRLGGLWRGDIEDEYGLATVIGTTAVVLKFIGQAETITLADSQARQLWERREKEKYPNLAN